MHGKEAIEMMKRASSEIKSLRLQIDILKPKAEAYDNMSIMLRMIPQPSQGYGEDLAWALDKRVRELEAASTAGEV